MRCTPLALAHTFTVFDCVYVHNLEPTAEPFGTDSRVTRNFQLTDSIFAVNCVTHIGINGGVCGPVGIISVLEFVEYGEGVHCRPMFGCSHFLLY